MNFATKGMIVVYFVIFFCSLAAAVSDKEELSVLHNIKKRNVWQFGNMIQCAQGRNSWLPLWAFMEYGNYGCWCGRNGQGEPVDESDRCCHEHDLCYIRVRDHLLATSQIAVKRFLSVYAYDCFGNNIFCADDDLKFKKDMCHCDMIAAKCLAHNRLSYKDSYTYAFANGQCEE